MSENWDLRCVGCNRRPDEIAEYIERAADEPDEYDSAADFVVKEEGTLNPHNGHFLCTDCYIQAGMPSSPTGWHAP